MFVHGLHSPLQNRHITGAFGIGIGVWVKAAFRGHTWATQLGHQRLVAQNPAVRFEVFSLGQSLANLSPVPAFHNRHRAQAFFATHQHVEQVLG